MTKTATPTATAAAVTAAALVGALADNPSPIADRNESTVYHWDVVDTLGNLDDIDAIRENVDTFDDGEIESLYSRSVKRALVQHVKPAIDGSSKTQQMLLDLFVMQSKVNLKGIDRAERKAIGSSYDLYQRVIADASEGFVQTVRDMADAAPAFCQALEYGYTPSVTLPGNQRGVDVVGQVLGPVRATSAENRRFALTTLNAIGE